jgi:hypothetical protein
MIKKFGCTGVPVARFLGMATASMNRMARPEELAELNGWDK